MNTMQCPHCGKPVALVKAAESGNGTRQPSNDAADGELTDAQRLEFLELLDGAHLDVSDFEAQFIEGAFERRDKYHGKAKFFGGQIGVVNKMIAKYGDKVGWTGPRPHVNAEDYKRRSEPAPASEPNPQPPKGAIPF